MITGTVSGGDSILAAQYNNLRKDAEAASWLLPHEQSSPNMTVKVEAGVFYFAGARVAYAGGSSGTITAPTTNPRIDLLCIDSSGSLSIVTGTEASSPTAPNYPTSKMVLCEIYLRVGATSIKDADDSSNGYIYKHSRPFIQHQESAKFGQYTAYEGINPNYPVAVNKQGSVENFVLAAEGSLSQYHAGDGPYKSICKISEYKIVAVYIVSGTIYARCATINMFTKTPTWGTEVTVATGAAVVQPDVIEIDTDKFVVSYGKSSSSGYVRVCTVSGTTITQGTETKFTTSSNVIGDSSIAKLDTDKFFIAYYDSTDTDGMGIVATVSGTTPSFGSEVLFTSDTINNISCCNLDTDKALVVYGNSTDTDTNAIAVSVSGTTPSFGSEVQVSTNQGSICAAGKLDTDKAIISYAYSAGNQQYARVVSVSGTTITLKSEHNYSSAVLQSLFGGRHMAPINSEVAIQVYSTNATSSYVKLNISGDTVSSDPDEPIYGDANGMAVVGLNEHAFATILDDNDDSGNGKMGVIAFESNTDKFIGVNKDTVSSGNPSVIQQLGKMDGFSGLTATNKYYWTQTASLTTNSASGIRAGIAVSSVSMDLVHFGVSF